MIGVLEPRVGAAESARVRFDPLEPWVVGARVEVDELLLFPVLPGAAEIARATELEIGARDRLAALEPRHRVEPLPCEPVEQLTVDQDAGAGTITAAHTSAELMELREPVALRVLDDDERRLRNVDTDLDDRCPDEHRRIARAEGVHRRALVGG